MKGSGFNIFNHFNLIGQPRMLLNQTNQGVAYCKFAPN